MTKDDGGPAFPVRALRWAFLRTDATPAELVTFGVAVVELKDKDWVGFAAINLVLFGLVAVRFMLAARKGDDR